MMGDMKESKKAHEESLRLKPSRQGYTNLGLKYYYAGQFDDAVEMQTMALDYAPDDHRVWGRLAERPSCRSTVKTGKRQACWDSTTHTWIGMTMQCA
jgi:tetratricopeptide (TPR) repeat protein